MTSNQELKLFEEKRDPDLTKGWGQIVPMQSPI